jgi:hypothetical protein
MAKCLALCEDTTPQPVAFSVHFKELMVQSVRCRNRRRRDRRPVRRQRADRARPPGFGLRAGACARRDRRRRVSDAQQRAPSAAGRPGAPRWRNGARGSARSRYFRHDGAPIAPVQVTDSSGWNATFGMHRADLVEMLAARCPPASCTPDTAAPASSRTATRRACRSPTAPRRSRRRHRRRRHPLRASALRLSAVRRCSTARSPTAAGAA